MNPLAIKHPKFSITENGIKFHEDLDFDEWEALGKELGKVDNTIGFMIGDWINYGDGRYGEKYQEAIDRTGIPYQRLRKYSHIARRVELLRRRNNLDFEHHAVVAKIKDPEEQQHWLKMAIKHKLSYRRLRKSINFGRLATVEETQGDPADRGYVTYLALLNRIRRWWYGEIEKAPVKEWDEERRKALKEDFKLILDIYEAL